MFSLQLFSETLKNLELNPKVKIIRHRFEKLEKMSLVVQQSLTFCVLVLICFNPYLCQNLLEGSGKDANESLQEITTSLPSTFEGVF